MAKRRNKANSGLVLLAGGALLAIIGVCLFLFMDSVQFYLGEDKIEDATFSGMQVVFGYKETTEILFVTSEVQVLKFSFMNFLPIVLIVLGIVFGVMKSKLFNIIGGALLLVAAVLFLFAGDFTVLTEDGKKLYDAIAGFVELKMKATTGAYLGAAFSGLGGLFLVGKAIVS